MLLRLAYLGVTNTLALLRLLPMSDRDKDTEILALRHQITVLQRQLHGQKVRFTPADRALLAALLRPLPRSVLRHIQLLVRPETVLRWHRDLIAARHAHISRPKRAGRPPTIRSIRVLVLRRQASSRRCCGVFACLTSSAGAWGPDPDAVRSILEHAQSTWLCSTASLLARHCPSDRDQ